MEPPPRSVYRDSLGVAHREALSEPPRDRGWRVTVRVASGVPIASWLLTLVEPADRRSRLSGNA